MASSAISIAAAGGSCSGASRCCPGRDASCLGAPDLKGRGGHCYCDEGCLETGDCCADYKKTCNVKGELIEDFTRRQGQELQKNDLLQVATCTFEGRGQTKARDYAVLTMSSGNAESHVVTGRKWPASQRRRYLAKIKKQK